jgi:hypothetical protein
MNSFEFDALIGLFLILLIIFIVLLVLYIFKSKKHKNSWCGKNDRKLIRGVLFFIFFCIYPSILVNHLIFSEPYFNVMFVICISIGLSFLSVRMISKVINRFSRFIKNGFPLKR